MTLFKISKIAVAITAIFVLISVVYSAVYFARTHIVLASDLRISEKKQYRYILPSLRRDRTDYRIQRGQLKILPQTNDTIKDIEAVNEKLELLDKSIKAIEKELDK